MRRAAWVAIGTAILLAGGPVAGAASSAKWTSVELTMKPRSDDAAAAWTVRLQADGAGTYSESGTATAETRPLTVSQETLARVKTGERAARSGRCETKTKNIAQTGEKTIRYDERGKIAECTFNYSDDAGLMETLAAFEAIAQTMQYGERLEHDLRYDRLGLDAEMDRLVAAKQDGSAIEMVNIAPVLEALVRDDQVIDRVRRKAARLLQDAGSAAPARTDSSEQ